MMNFFCTEKHYQDWTAAKGIGEDEAFCLNANAALRVAQELFGE